MYKKRKKNTNVQSILFAPSSWTYVLFILCIDGDVQKSQYTPWDLDECFLYQNVGCEFSGCFHIYMMRVFRPNGLYFIRYVTYLFSNPYPGETQTTSTHRTNLTLHFIVVNIFRIIALGDSNLWLYIRCNVYYYPAAPIHIIILCVGVLNTLEWTLSPINFSNILCHNAWYYKKYILWSSSTMYFMYHACNLHDAEYWRYTIYHL